MTLMHLKSGSDIRGSAWELSSDVVVAVVNGYLDLMSEGTGKDTSDMKISVGMDPRLSSPSIYAVVIESMVSAGVKVMECGLCSTPAMFMTTVTHDCDGAVMVTASHLPGDKNGLKFFDRGGGLEPSEIERILSFAEHFDAAPYRERGRTFGVEYLTEYARRLRETVIEGVDAEDRRHPLAGFRIVVDAGNGVGGFYADYVLAPLGADTTGSQFLEPDGNFPNHIPNPENKTAIGFLRDAVNVTGADLGVIFDTDVDRAACVGPGGVEINRNRLVALASAIALEEHPGGTIVTDSVTSDGVHDFITGTLGGKHRRFKRGYKNVIDEARRLSAAGEDAPLAIETSGHAAFSDNYYLDDGAYLVTKIIIKAALLRAEGRTLADLTASLVEPVEADEARFPITAKDFRAYGETVIKEVTAYAENAEGWEVAPDNFEGVRVSFPDGEGAGWFLLRLSVHDPVMPLNIESREAGGVEKIKSKLYPVLKHFAGLGDPSEK